LHPITKPAFSSNEHSGDDPGGREGRAAPSSYDPSGKTGRTLWWHLPHYRFFPVKLHQLRHQADRRSHPVQVLLVGPALRLGWDLFSSELNEYVISVPPQQRVGNKWYQGTADAIFQNIYMIGRDPPDHLLVLAGDHIYKMNYSVMFEFHMAHHADATVAAIEISRQAAASFGVLEVADDCRIVGFEESHSTRSPSRVARIRPSPPWVSICSIRRPCWNI